MGAGAMLSYGCNWGTCDCVAHAPRHAEHLPHDMSKSQAAALTWELRRSREPQQPPENQVGRRIPAACRGPELTAWDGESRPHVCGELGASVHNTTPPFWTEMLRFCAVLNLPVFESFYYGAVSAAHQTHPMEATVTTFLRASMLQLSVHAACHALEHEKTNNFAAKHFA